MSQTAAMVELHSIDQLIVGGVVEGQQPHTG
jgi:hypothetical protein